MYFQELLVKVSPLITKRDTIMRSSIPLKECLAVTDMPTFGVSKEGDEILVGSGGVLPPGNFLSSVMAFPAF
jgi:hypothetical protein